MKREVIDDSLWFHHANGSRFYPWVRFSKHHGHSSFWVSDGSNHIADAIPVVTVAELIQQVFTKGRSIWLCDGGSPGKCGLYRFGARVIRGWDGTDQAASLALAAGAPTRMKGRVTVPGKPNDDLAPGTLSSILKQASIKR